MACKIAAAPTAGFRRAGYARPPCAHRLPPPTWKALAADGGALAIAALSVVLAAATLMRQQIAALWYERRLDHGPEAERAVAIRRLAATKTERGLRRVLRILIEEPASQEREIARAPRIPVKGLIAVDPEAARGSTAFEALVAVGSPAVPVARAVIEEVVARGDLKEIELAARSLGPLVIPLGYLEDWAVPVTGHWIEALKRGHSRAASAAERLRALGVASMPALLDGLGSEERFLATWSESILWQMAEKSEPACRGLLHAHAGAAPHLRTKIIRVCESAGAMGQAFFEAALKDGDPTLARAAREVLDELTARRSVLAQ